MNILILVIIILLLPIVWLSLDFHFGKKKQIEKPKRKNYPFRNSEFKVFTSGPELFEDYFLELKQAKRHIHIMFYIVKNDDFSQEFLQILKNKAQEGLEVRLLLDRIGSIKIKKKTIHSLRESGVQFSFAQKPKFPFLFYTLQTRNHRKITVIDAKIGYVGGFNIGKEYINQDQKLSPWRDYHLKLTGEGVTDLQREFLQDWSSETNVHLLDEPSYFPAQPKKGSLHQLIPSKGTILEETFSAFICKAQHQIIIGTPYFIPSHRLLNDLLAALKRGVSISILIPLTADHILVKEAAFPYLRKLLKNGALVYEYQNGFYHAKTAIFDQEVCDIGTANFDRRSLFLNEEINCYIYDREFISKLLSIIEKDISHSKTLTLNELTKPDVSRKFKEFIAKLVEDFL